MVRDPRFLAAGRLLRLINANQPRMRIVLAGNCAHCDFARLFLDLSGTGWVHAVVKGVPGMFWRREVRTAV